MRNGDDRAKGGPDTVVERSVRGGCSLLLSVTCGGMWDEDRLRGACDIDLVEGGGGDGTQKRVVAVVARSTDATRGYEEVVVVWIKGSSWLTGGRWTAMDGGGEGREDARRIGSACTSAASSRGRPDAGLAGAPGVRKGCKGCGWRAIGG